MPPIHLRALAMGELASREAKPLEALWLQCWVPFAHGPNSGPLDAQKVRDHFSKVSLDKDWLRNALLLGLAMQYTILEKWEYFLYQKLATVTCCGRTIQTRVPGGFCVGYIETVEETIQLLHILSNTPAWAYEKVNVAYRERTRSRTQRCS